MVKIMKIYTIGHSTRNLKEFLDVLNHFDIELVIDVRRFPSSKRFPWFNKESLEEELAKNNVQYIHFPELGGFRKEGYFNFSQTKEFDQAIKRLIETIDDKTATIMCAEWNVMRCHRWYISEFLSKRGHKVIHVVNVNNTKDHGELPKKGLKILCDRKIKAK